MDLIKNLSAARKKGAQNWAYKRTKDGADYDTDGVREIAITEAGAGYVTAPAITFTGGNGTGAAAHCEIEAGKVVAVIIDNPGVDYTEKPTVAFADPPQGGTKATGTASLVDVWHPGSLRKASEITFEEPDETDELEDGTPTYPEPGKVTAKVQLTLGQDDEATIKFLMRESRKYEFSIFYEKGKSTGTTTQHIFVPQTRLERKYSSKSGDRKPIAGFNLVKNLTAITPSDVPEFASGVAADYTVPEGQYFEVRDL